MSNFNTKFLAQLAQANQRDRENAIETIDSNSQALIELPSL